MKNLDKIGIVILLVRFTSMELEILGTRLISPIFDYILYTFITIEGVLKSRLKFLTF